MTPDLILPTAILILIAIVGRILAGTWLSPGPFFAIIWAFIVVLSLSSPLFDAPIYPVWAGALWWIDLQVAMLVVGDLVAQGSARRPPVLPPYERELKLLPTLPYATFIVIFCAICSVVYALALDSIEGAGHQPPTALQIILAFHYMGAIFGGLVYALGNSRRAKVLGLASLVPGIAFSVFLTGRTAMVAQFTFWFAGYFSMRLYLSDKVVHLFTKGRVAAAVVCLSFFFVISIVVQPFRSVPRGLSPVERFQRYSEALEPVALDNSWEYMKPGFFGHVSAFSWYFERAWETPPAIVKPGSKTFYGFFRLLDIEQTPVQKIEIGGVDTNVFTIFKPIIEDYTLGGSVAVFLILGFLGGWSYRQLVDGKRLWPAAFLIMYYNNSTISGGWYFNYNSVTAAHVFIYLYLIWFQSKMRDASNEVPALGFAKLRAANPIAGLQTMSATRAGISGGHAR